MSGPPLGMTLVIAETFSRIMNNPQRYRRSIESWLDVYGKKEVEQSILFEETPFPIGLQ